MKRILSTCIIQHLIPGGNQHSEGMREEAIAAPFITVAHKGVYRFHVSDILWQRPVISCTQTAGSTTELLTHIITDKRHKLHMTHR